MLGCGCRVTLAAALAVSLPSRTFARGPEAPAADAAPVGTEEVQRVYAEGKAKFDTHDYAGAIEAWTEALAQLPATTENREIRNDLVYNIATAREKAYDIDRDVAHLRAARALLVDFVDEYKRIYTPTDEGRAEVARVNERIAKLDARIAAEEQAASGPPDGGVASPRPATVKDVLVADPPLYAQYKRGRGMVIGGSILISFAAVSLPIVIVGLAVPDRDLRGIAIGFGTLAVAGIVGGSVLLGFGVPKRRNALDTARSRLVVTPTLGPRGALAGFGFAARF